jgi:hypothetical protein
MMSRSPTAVDGLQKGAEQLGRHPARRLLLTNAKKGPDHQKLLLDVVVEGGARPWHGSDEESASKRQHAGVGRCGPHKERI